jgi:hypothetical protein
MVGLCCAADFLLIPSSMEAAVRGEHRFKVPRNLKPYWFATSEALMRRLFELSKTVQLTLAAIQSSESERHALHSQSDLVHRAGASASSTPRGMISGPADLP